MTVEQIKRIEELEAQIKELKAEADKIKKAMQDEMGNEEHVSVGGYNVNYTIVISTTLDGTRLKKEDPELWNKYSKEGITRRFSITLPVPTK